MANEDWMFRLPSCEMIILDVVFGLPNQWTNGQYINMLVAGFYGTFFIAAMQLQERPNIPDASVYAVVTTFITTFGLVLLSVYADVTIAGQNQLIPVTMVLIISILWKYMSSGGDVI